MENTVINKAKEIGIRLLVWGLVISITLLCYGVKKLINWIIAPIPEIYVNYNINNIKDFSSIENVSSINGYEIIYNQTSDAVAIIDKPDLEKENYTEINKSIYSPLVMYVGIKATDVDSGFSVSDTNFSNSNIKVQKNLFNILDAMENNKTWQDIGINSDVLEGTVRLAVPDKYSPYRDQVKDLFMLNLTEKDITSENYNELSLRADDILNKCIQVEDPKSYLVMNKDKENAGKIVLIAPEYIMRFDRDNIFPYNNSNYDKENFFVPVYPTKTTAIAYSLYIKNGIDVELKESIINSYNGKIISTKTGFRNAKTNDYSVIGNNIVSSINIQYIDKIIK